MSSRIYGLYHYDTLDQEVGDPIVEEVTINEADKEAWNHANQMAQAHNKKWHRVQSGDRCTFEIDGRRMGYIVMKCRDAPTSNSPLKPQYNHR